MPSLAIKKEVLGEKHLSTAISYANLAELYQAQREYSKALPLYKKSLVINEELLGEKHPDTALNYSSMGLIYLSLKKCNEANRYMLRAINALKSQDYIHPSLLEYQKNLKDIEQTIKKQQKAGYKKKGKYCIDV